MKNKKQTIISEKHSPKLALILFKLKAVTFRFDPPYTFTSGIKSPIYTDNRVVMSHPKERNKVVDMYVEIIKKNIGLKNVDVISATATAAIPLGAWVADRLKLPLVFVRSSSKKHGKGNKMEGHLKKDAKVVIVEDLISTAGSVENNVKTIKKLGGKVKFVIASITYETKESERVLKRNKAVLYVLSTGALLADQAIKQKLISKDKKDVVLEWLKDPVKWTKNHGK